MTANPRKKNRREKQASRADAQRTAPVDIVCFLSAAATRPQASGLDYLTWLDDFLAFVPKARIARTRIEIACALL